MHGIDQSSWMHHAVYPRHSNRRFNMTKMKRIAGMAILTVVLLTGGSLSAQADTPALTNHDILKTLTTTPTAEQRDRADVEAFLSRDDVRSVADAHGIDMTHAHDAVQQMDGSDLAGVAQQIRASEAQLAGGDSVVIGSTALIIILLLIILIIVA
jgi:hypothetical protein